MISAFGIIHKAEREYHRDSKGRFATILVTGSRTLGRTGDEHADESVKSTIRALLEDEADMQNMRTGRKVRIVHGGAKGADEIADKHAKDSELIDHAVAVKADWKKHGRAAGPIRNQQMLDEYDPDIVMAFKHQNPDGSDEELPSKGTDDMVKRAQKAGKRVVTWQVM